MCGIVEREMFGNRAVFIDRDDTVAKDVPYCHDPDLFNLYEGVPEAIRRLNESGFKVIMITNQSGIGRGYFTLDELNAVNSKMCREIEAKGGHLDDIFYCPHTPEDHCSCRKPEIGMGIQAIMKHGINPKRSFMVGDHDKDIEFGKRLGCRSIKVGPDFTFVDAVEMILRMN
jgi:histidinol-phosphate phosphatase family protein